ncbi:hypothetical protein SLE2022_179400 [Rubroshorea leprosula]
MEQLPLERRPRMLKDFLLDDSNSSSSCGFKSFPRRKCQDREPCVPNLIQIDLNSNRCKLQRSRSKAAAGKMSAFQSVINAVKNIHFATVKSPTFFSRSLPRRNSNRVCHKKENEVKFKVITVKDIMRWQSFCEFVDEKSPPQDFVSSPQHCTTTRSTTTTASSTTTPYSNNRSSCCESDCTSEYLPEECGENNLQCVGEDSVQTTRVVASESAVGPKGELEYEEEEQQSPVSVLGFQYEEDEEPVSSYNQSLAHMEREKQKLMQKIRHFECVAKMDPTNLEEWMTMEEEEDDDDDDDDAKEETDGIEKKAKWLLDHAKATSSLGTDKNNMDKLLLDLFREELYKNKDHGRNDGIENEMVRIAESWINRESREIVDWVAEDMGEIFLRDVDRGGWSKFEEEQEELAFEVECGMVNYLVDELLGDLLLS